MFHLLLKVLVIARKQKPFDGANASVGPGELLSNFIDRRGQFFGRDNPIDQSPSHSSSADNTRFKRNSSFVRGDRSGGA